MSTIKNSIIERALFVSGLPHSYLAPEKSPHWQSLHDSYKKLQESIATSNADLILYFSTQWPSVIGYLFQANPSPEWTHVDHEWHEYGKLPYRFQIDSDFSKAYAEEVHNLGYNSAAVNYRGFPIDTGTIVAQKFLNPENKFPASMVSCGLYAEKEESLQIGRAAGRALAKSGKRAIAVLVSALSHRFFTHEINPKDDKISSAKDDEWNRKILELLGEGRLEDVSQCAREFSREANGDMNFKGIWWLAGLCGESNHFKGKVYDYQPVWGTGNALVELIPTKAVIARQDPPSNLFDGEGKNRVQQGENSVTRPAQGSTSPAKFATTATTTVLDEATKTKNIIYASSAAEPVGAYPHARWEGDLLFLSGVGPREPGTKKIPGVTLDSSGNIQAYDIEVQTRSVIRNVEAILLAAGENLESIIDIQVFLTNMKTDFPIFNRVYAEYFSSIAATRTTIEVGSLPTPIAVEFKVVARKTK